MTTEADWTHRKDDIEGAWADDPDLTGRLRTLALTPLSLAEHGFNRARQAGLSATLRPALATALHLLKSEPEAQPYGTALAKEVAQAMINRTHTQPNRTATLCNMHRDYCGMGLTCQVKDGIAAFDYGPFEDGYPDTALMGFANEADFIVWLARQSDLSLSGVTGPEPLKDWKRMGNQRLNRARLEAYIAPSPNTAY